MKNYLMKNWVQIVLGLALGGLVVSVVLAEEVIDESGVDIPVSMPSVAIPTVQIPVVVIPVVVIPQVCLVTILTPAEMATIVDNPSITLDTVLIPNADSSNITLDTVLIPNAGNPVRAFRSSPVVTKPMSKSDLISKVILPSIQDAGKGVAENLVKLNTGIANEMTFQKTDHPKNFIGDKRTIQYLRDIGSGNLIWKAWKAVYAKDYPPMVHVRVPDVTQIKMICEMKATQTQAERDNLIKELTYFKSFPVVIDGRTVYQSYNTVLAVWEGEAPSTLLEQIALVKGMGYKVFFSYGTRERLEDKIFIDPEKYRYGLTLLASSCDGYLVGWRRTSLHLFKADNKFVDYSISCVRQGNTTIPVFGEIYRGYAGNTNKDGSYNENEFCINVPANASGAFVVNFGFQGVRPDGVLKLIRASTDVPLIALIVGERPYYMSRNDNKKSKAENRTIIDGIEKRFKKFDFGTATLAGDGSNEIYNKNVSDDLCQSAWSK